MAKLPIDERYMAAALRLAQRGLGRAWPNPSVGALVVDPDQRILGVGRTADGGRPHAETVALNRAGEAARGATLYVTLEPCAHQGQTSPCVEAIIAAGIARVVCGLGDPDTRVAGQGFARLENAGIQVEKGVLEKSARKICAGHVFRTTKQRPYVQLKFAVSRNGLISAPDNQQISITGETANAWVHRMRAQADAIMVGIGTVAADNPDLTCRLPGAEALSPNRIVVDSQLRIGLESQLVLTANKVPTWIVTSDDSCDERRHALEAHNVRIFTANTGENGYLDLLEVLRVLAGQGITRLMVEGGAHVARSLYLEGLADEIVLIEGSQSIDNNGLKAFVDHGPELVRNAKDYRLCEQISLGNDEARIYRRQE